MKKLLLLPVLLHALIAAGQPIKSRSFKTGIYIFCGTELPKNFSYIIERNLVGDTTWATIAELNAPKGEADCEKAILRLPASIAAITNIQSAEIRKLWRKIQSARIIDSLSYFRDDPRFQYVAGCALFDEGIHRNGTYQYKVTRLNRNGSRELLKQEKVVFPENTYRGTLTPKKFRPGEQNIRLTYAIGDSLNTAGVRLYRSKYEERKFAEVPSNALFTMENDRQVVELTDAGTVEGVTYTYVAVPIDALGNEGKPADTLNIYNLVKSADVGLIQRFAVTPKEKERGNLLEWKLKTNMGIGSIDVYRSSAYDGTYQKLISLPPRQTMYFDNKDLRPSKAYYYYILANNGYGTNLPGPRVPAILKGSVKNLFPPQNLMAHKKGNVVELTFTKMEKDTRGYYIYRGRGYKGTLKQLPRMLLSTDSVLTFKDTLPESNMPEVYSYAVADINSSYNISPLTERVNVLAAAMTLPVPLNVAAIYRHNSVFITWKDVSAVDASISGYQLYRTTANNDGTEAETPKRIALVIGNNFFMDSNITAGRRYHYYVQTLGFDSSALSSLSRPASASIPEDMPLQPGMVRCYAGQNKIVVQWEPPAGTRLKAIKIYRAVMMHKALLISELQADEKQYVDKAVKAGETYYYYIVTVGPNNTESKPTNAVSAKIRG